MCFVAFVAVSHNNVPLSHNASVSHESTAVSYRTAVSYATSQCTAASGTFTDALGCIDLDIECMYVMLVRGL
jgi:hypothetical protein